MSIFSLPTDNPVPEPIFTYPADTPQVKITQNTKNREKVLYPVLTGLPKEEVEPAVESGLTGEIAQAADAASKQTEFDRIGEKVAEGFAEGKPYEQTLEELDSYIKSDPMMAVVISPATVNALRQSKNPIVRQAAQRKLANTAIALELIQEKQEEAASEGFLTNFDFVDAFVSDLPLLSFSNLSNRKAWADQFATLMESSEDPAYIKDQMKSLLDQAADQGLFTQSNRFYLGDFLDILSEGRYSTSAMLQGTFATLDAAFAIAILADAAKLLSVTGRGEGAIKETLEDAVKMDDPIAGHSTPSNFEESLVTPRGARPEPRTAEEANAVLDLNLEFKMSDELLKIRAASGQAIEPDAWEAFKAEKIADVKAKAEAAGVRRYIDADLQMDVFENIQLVERYGTIKGRNFSSPIAAQKFAESLGGADVVEVAPKQWIVEKRSNVPTGEFYKGKSVNEIASELRLYSPTEPRAMGTGLMAKYFYSPLSQTDSTRNALLKQGEAARAKALEDLDKLYLPVVKAAGNEGVQAVGRVIQDVRDGSRAHLRHDLSVPQFRNAFKELNKRMPTEAEEQLYVMTIQRNIDDYLLKADTLLKHSVNKGIEMFIVGDLEMQGVKASRGSVGEGRVIWDVDQNKYVTMAELGEQKQIIRLVEPEEFDGKLHDVIATNTPKTRALKHTDVLGYNPGGSRLYLPNQVNHILKQDRVVTMADGTERPAAPITIMVGKTEKEIAKAQADLEEVISAVHAAVPPTTGLRKITSSAGDTTTKPIKKWGSKPTEDTKANKTWQSVIGDSVTAEDYFEAVLAKQADVELNNAIAKASGWNPNVHSVKTLVEYFKEAGLDLRKAISRVEDGQPIIKGDDLVGDFSFRDALASPGTLRKGNVRRDKVLMGYGGKDLETLPPMEAIQRSYMSGVARMTDVAYEASAINGLLRRLIMPRAGETYLLSPKHLEEMRWLPLRQKLKYLEGKIPQGTKLGQQLEMERQKILWRLEKRNFLDAYVQQQRDALSRAIYDKDWKAASAKVDSWSAEPVAAIRGITFDVMMGLGNWVQFIVQGSHVINILGVADRGNGLKALATMPVVRWLVRNGHQNVTEAMATRMAKVLNIEPKQFSDMVRLFQESGRNSVSASLADLGEDASGRFRLKKIREAGRVFYNEGERVSRITAHMTASLEYIAKAGPQADLMSVQAKRWIANREDALTFAMTSQSRTSIEQLPMAQFMSYTMRMFEFLTSGLVSDFKNIKAGGKWTEEFGPLSLKHKTKLFLTQLAFYGAAAVPGANYLLDNWDAETGVLQNNPMPDYARKGVVDGLVGYMLGVETELGRRLAWGEGLWTLFQDVGEESIGELALGPSYNVAKDVVTSTSRLARNVANQQTDLLLSDLMTVARTITSINTGYNAYLAFGFGEYWTKTHQLVSSEIDPYEAAAIAFGIPVEDVNKVWRARKQISARSKDYRDMAKIPSEIHRQLAFEYEHNGFNTERAYALRKSLEFFYSSLTPYEAKEVDRYVDSKAISLHEKTIIDMLRTPFYYEAN